MELYFKLLTDRTALQNGGIYYGEVNNFNINNIYIDTFLLELGTECKPATNFGKFVLAYAKELQKDMLANPQDWFANADALKIAFKMSIGLTSNTASLSNIAKKACRKLKVGTTYSAIKSYLLEDFTGGK